MKLKKVFCLLLVAVMMLTMLILPVHADAQVPEVLGASIRTSGAQGLRFVARIKISGSISLVTGANANFGFLIIPASSTDGGEINASTPLVKKVKAEHIMGQQGVEAAGLDYDDSYYYFSVVQTNIPANFYGTDFVTKAYVENGNGYIYSDSPLAEKRSIKYVAETIKGQQGANAPAFVDTVLADCAAQGYDIYVNGNRFFPEGGSYASSALQNTYARLTTAKKLNVAYLGGSVTVGVGIGSSETQTMQQRRDTLSWRGITTNWLKTNYPNATITETYAAIGGTGSIFGAYRCIDDLKLNDSARKPDLLFIDFAINDQYDAPGEASAYAADVRKYMETIVRTVYEYAPFCDIVFVYVTDSTRLAYTDSTNYPTLAAQHDVALKYGLSEIYVGKQLCESQGITNSTQWTNSGLFYDIVHPVVEGYALYGSYVTSALNTELSKSLNPIGYVAHSAGSASYSPISNPARYFLNGSSGKTTGFTLHEDSGSLLDKGYLKSNTAGAKLKFTFTGTGLQLWTYARTTSSTIRVTIDGSSTNYTIQRGGSDNNKAYRVASGLSNTTHTVTIELTAVPSDTDKAFTLEALMVEGDPNFTGVTFQTVS